MEKDDWYGDAPIKYLQAAKEEGKSEPVAWMEEDNLVIREDMASLLSLDVATIAPNQAIPDSWKPLFYTRESNSSSEVNPVAPERSRLIWDVPEGVRSRLIKLMVGGCTCGMKTPETDYHSDWCVYRLASEIEAELALCLSIPAFSHEPERSHPEPVAWQVTNHITNRAPITFLSRNQKDVDEYTARPGEYTVVPLYLHPPEQEKDARIWELEAQLFHCERSRAEDMRDNQGMTEATVAIKTGNLQRQLTEANRKLEIAREALIRLSAWYEPDETVRKALEQIGERK